MTEGSLGDAAAGRAAVGLVAAMLAGDQEGLDLFAEDVRANPLGVTRALAILAAVGFSYDRFGNAALRAVALSVERGLTEGDDE